MPHKHTMHTNNTPNAFSSDYQSQITPFKPTTFKRPAVQRTPNINLQDNIGGKPDLGKQARLLKTSI